MTGFKEKVNMSNLFGMRINLHWNEKKYYSLGEKSYQL